MVPRANRAFFQRHPDEVARGLLGARMTVRDERGAVVVRIVETEAYGGEDDEASHAHRGRSARTAAMFGPPGHLYVYFIYGRHWCVNVVTQPRDVASAVLLRAGEVLEVKGERDTTALPTLLRGPGLLTRALGITGDDNGRDCCVPGARVSFDAPTTRNDAEIATSPRAGISTARERPSRYYLLHSPAVSKSPK